MSRIKLLSWRPPPETASEGVRALFEPVVRLSRIDNSQTDGPWDPKQCARVFYEQGNRYAHVHGIDLTTSWWSPQNCAGYKHERRVPQYHNAPDWYAEFYEHFFGIMRDDMGHPAGFVFDDPRLDGESRGDTDWESHFNGMLHNRYRAAFGADARPETFSVYGSEASNTPGASPIGTVMYRSVFEAFANMIRSGAIESDGRKSYVIGATQIPWWHHVGNTRRGGYVRSTLADFTMFLALADRCGIGTAVIWQEFKNPGDRAGSWEQMARAYGNFYAQKSGNLSTLDYAPGTGVNHPVATTSFTDIVAGLAAQSAASSSSSEKERVSAEIEDAGDDGDGAMAAVTGEPAKIEENPPE